MSEKQRENNEKHVANPGNIIGKGNRFSSTNQPQRNGRKPSTYALIKKLFGTDAEAELSKEDVVV